MPGFDELEDFRQEVRTWLGTKKIPRLPSDYIEVFQVRREWQRELYRDGWLGLSWPAEFGGRGLTAMHQIVFNQELAEAGAPSPIGTAGIDVIGPTIIEYGTSEQKSEILPRILSADDIWCQGFSEPDSGSDLASLSTRAEAVDGGYVINGHKVWSTWSHMASRCAVLARTDPKAPIHRGISYMLVDLDTPGITVHPIAQLNGESEFGEIVFDDVHVASDALLGDLNSGWKYALHTLSSERSKYAIRRTRDMMVYLAEALTQAQAAGFIWSDMQLATLGRIQADMYALQAQCERAARRTMADAGADPTDSFDKMALTRMEQNLLRFIRNALGRFGNITSGTPYGLDADQWVRRYLYSRVASVYGGSAQIQRNIVSERILGLPAEKAR